MVNGIKNKKKSIIYIVNSVSAIKNLIKDKNISSESKFNALYVLKSLIETKVEEIVQFS